MRIPRRIVQTQRNEALAAASRDSWMLHHPAFDYCFYDDAASRRLIADDFPDLLGVYDRLPLAAQKSDMFRYAAIFIGGGVYSDTDTLCTAALETYADLDSETLLVGVEMQPDHYANGIRGYSPAYPIPRQILQWTFAASPGHPALGLLLRRIAYSVSLMTQQQLEDWSRQSVRFTLELTSPILFTQVCSEFLSGTREGRIDVLPRMCWGSWPHEQANPLLHEQIKVRHLFEGSWKPKATVSDRISYRVRLN